jgi:hypothetical protein
MANSQTPVFKTSYHYRGCVSGAAITERKTARDRISLFRTIDTPVDANSSLELTDVLLTAHRFIAAAGLNNVTMLAAWLITLHYSGRYRQYKQNYHALREIFLSSSIYIITEDYW